MRGDSQGDHCKYSSKVVAGAGWGQVGENRTNKELEES